MLCRICGTGLALTSSSNFAQRYELRYRIDISDATNYSHFDSNYVEKIMLAPHHVLLDHL